MKDLKVTNLDGIEEIDFGGFEGKIYASRFQKLRFLFFDGITTTGLRLWGFKKGKILWKEREKK